MKVWIVVDVRYSQCDEWNCDCSGIIDEVFDNEQVAKQWADHRGGRVSERKVQTKFPY